MKKFFFFSPSLVAAVLCLALASPALAADAAAKSASTAKTPVSKASVPANTKVASPAKKTSSPAKKSSKSAPKAAAKKKSAPANSPEALQRGLDEFAKTTIATLNRCVVPSSGKKAISKNADGSFTARYIEIDPKSVKTSYKTPEKPGPVAYIGYMSYTESEYQCTAPSKEAAAKGPFTPKSSKMLTELIKHLNGKWTY